MSEYTTEELIKSNRLCVSGDCGSECYFYIYDEFCQDELKAHSAERLESQQKEIAELKKQIAETYTAEQFSKDLAKYFDSREIDYPLGILMVKDIKRWCNEIPEKPKVTNGDKFREVFGHKNLVKCYAESMNNCPVDDCEECEYGTNGEDGQNQQSERGEEHTKLLGK